MSYHQSRRRTVIEYVRASGANPFRDWHDSLDSHAASKVTIAIARLRDGNASHLKPIGEISEIVIDWGPGYRVYLVEDGDSLIVLFGGGTKMRQQADIDRARRLCAEYRRNRGG
jgi:putative addiction module killer protein